MTSKSSKLHRRSGLSVFLPAFLFIALPSSLWALASPIFSSPDENAHAAKAIALVRGEVVGHRVEGQRQLVVDLPQSYSYSPSIVCFAYHPDVTANCGTELGAATGNDWFASWVEAYNPIYYYLVGWPSLLFGGSAGIYAMRIASAIVSAVLLAWAFQVGLASRAARWLPVGLAFLASPMIVYLAGSVTPQGIEVASASALWIGLIRLLEHHRDASSVLLPRWYLWAIVTMSASLLALARALGPLWLVCLVGAALVIVGWQPTKRLFTRRGSYVWIAIIAAAGVFSLLWTLQGGSLSGQAVAGDAPLVGGTFVQGFWAMIRNTPRYLQGAMGVFGWLDTTLPVLGYAVYFGAVLLVAVLAVTSTGRRGMWTVLGTVALAMLVPIFVQSYSVSQTGIIWQGRYALFLYVGVLLVAAWLLSGPAATRIAFLSVRVTAIVVVLLAAYGILAYVIALRRYVVGAHGDIGAMIRDPHWQPPLGWPTLAAIMTVTIVAFSAWVIHRAVEAVRADDSVPKAIG